MKLFSSITVLMSVLLISMASLAQQNNETEIRNLEKQEGEAFAKKDMIALLKLFSPNLVVNSPVNKVFGFADVMNMIRNRKIDVGPVEKVIEKITFVENIAIVMGHDIVTPQGAMDNAGKTLTRRYTDIWMKDKNSWRLSARQATIISVF
jgi:ketosteroid isomerase-like protein